MAERKFEGMQKMSHAYIVSAATPEQGLEAALGIAAAALCSAGGDTACGVCRDCRKLKAGVHPDLMRVSRAQDDKGRYKREIVVDQIRSLSADAIILPNEAGRKVYIIEQADAMNLPAQNAILKLLEEPPAGAMFILCVTNAALLLPTVHSRCVQLVSRGEKTQQSPEACQILAKDYMKHVASGDAARLFIWCSANEGMDAREARQFIDCALELVADMLCGREPALGMAKLSLLELRSLLDKCGAYLKLNVGVKHIFGLLAVKSCAGRENRGKTID